MGTSLSSTFLVSGSLELLTLPDPILRTAPKAYVIWCGSVEGALYYSNYRIRQLEYEIALLRAESGEIDRSSLESAEAEFQLAESLFVNFWESFGIAD